MSLLKPGVNKQHKPFMLLLISVCNHHYFIFQKVYFGLNSIYFETIEKQYKYYTNLSCHGLCLLAVWPGKVGRLMKRNVQRLFHKFKKVKSTANWESYKKLRNDYQQALDQAEHDYKNSLTDSLADSKDSKVWWRTVKSLLGKGSFRSLPIMKDNNKNLIGSKEKADAFNNFFLSHSNIDTSNAQLPPEENFEAKLISVKASEQEVLDLLMSLDTSKATGPDGIGPKLLREAGPSIAPSLTRLINLCLDSAQVPQMWKHANVMPLFKKGDASQLNNYRPVSLLPCASKILERIVFKNVYNYLRDNHILSPHQSGFQSGDSTVNQLAYLYHVFSKALDAKKDVRIVFCDVSKAFDRVWHEGLLYKLAKIGIGGKLLEFCKNFLSDRSQCVIVDGQQSDIGRVRAGVPQGAVSGPLYFLIYINDLTEGIKSNIKLFADDTSLSIEVNDPVQGAEVLNRDLEKVKEWANRWLVNFSVEKTKLMTCSFRSINHPDIVFDGKALPETSTHKHLGLTFNSDLSWSSHIKSILDSVSPMADVLKKLKYKVDKESLEKIYFSFIRPKLEYGSFIWDNCQIGEKEELEKFQMSIARTVTGARKGTSHDLILNELNWPSLADRREGAKLKNFIKIINKESPVYLQDLIPKRIGDIRPQSRYPDNFYTVKSRIETFRKSFIPSAVNLWNSLKDSDRTLTYADSLLKKTRPPLLYYGSRTNNYKHAQLRMKCSKLNFHLYSLHVLDSPACPCGHNREDSSHYLLLCPLYFQARITMLNKIRHLTRTHISCDLLLYGAPELDLVTNYKVFDAVHEFISSTDRL